MLCARRRKALRARVRSAFWRCTGATSPLPRLNCAAVNANVEEPAAWFELAMLIRDRQDWRPKSAARSSAPSS
ncbi:MAG: hypothetical protein HS123_15935 [Solibacteraceae bacterium]|nr:hypothetical protein [Solibacteraceae bacterium]